jgi:hypothetical protein
MITPSEAIEAAGRFIEAVQIPARLIPIYRHSATAIAASANPASHNGTTTSQSWR